MRFHLRPVQSNIIGYVHIYEHIYGWSKSRHREASDCTDLGSALRLVK